MVCDTFQVSADVGECGHPLFEFVPRPGSLDPDTGAPGRQFRDEGGFVQSLGERLQICVAKGAIPHFEDRVVEQHVGIIKEVIL